MKRILRLPHYNTIMHYANYHPIYPPSTTLVYSNVFLFCIILHLLYLMQSHDKHA